MKVPGFSDFGKSAKEVLYGGGKGGTYQYDQKLKLSSKATDGMAFTLSSTVKGDKVSGEFKSSYSYERYSVDATVNNANKVTVKGNIADFLVPGLKCTGSFALPATSPSKVGLQYTRPYLNTKVDVDATTSPKVTASLATGYAKMLYGADCTYDSAKGAFSSWSFGTVYTGPGYEATALYNDKGILKALHAQNLDDKTVLGVEIVRSLKDESSQTFAFGLTRLLNSGVLIKGKAESSGVTSVLYEHQIEKGVKLALSGQFDAKNLDKGAKVGASLEIS
ncbi:unnamed protein product [Ostreobium quekettii]|uniref:Voltage-dependent anion-selective channel n=1 Tax=Ostreobium quekettii TaxID=121088 RepID=A0A8S1IWC6_9CHLO|nr:unnamed protein product [Ostreobium quekettii]|eukprot:evm.model.scf_799.5 EVM.evm.TU.scf_799.5   scf_799:42216-43836(+)